MGDKVIPGCETNDEDNFRFKLLQTGQKVEKSISFEILASAYTKTLVIISAQCFPNLYSCLAHIILD